MPGRGAWRINEDIIEDQEVENNIKTEIDQHFLTNDTPELSTALIWEAHKAVIRGQLIVIGSRKKKERDINMRKILKEIHDLEQRHKINVEKETQQALILKMELLKDLMEQETRKEFNRLRKDRYKGANKPGKYLAKMLGRNKSLNYIEKIKNGRGEMVNKTADIATAFQTYYSALYTIRKEDTHKEKRQEKIQEYLKNAKLPKIHKERLTALEAVITQEEIIRALKETSRGKSPGPDGFIIKF